MCSKVKGGNELLVSLISDILGDTRKENDYKGQYSWDCPVCSGEKSETSGGDGKGNLEVNLNKGVYKCWACSETHDTHGSVGKLISRFGTKKELKQYSLIKPDNYGMVKKVDGKPIGIIQLPDSFVKFEDSDNNWVYRKGMEYLEARKITKDIIYKYNMGYTTEGEYRYRIIIPSYDEHSNINYFVTRSFMGHKMKYKNPEALKEEIIFNENLINWDSTVYLVEGIFDAIVLPNAIPMLGKVLYEKLFADIIMKAKGYVVIVLDADANDNAFKIYRALDGGRLKDRVRVVNVPEKYGDISMINQLFGKKGVVKVIRKCKKLEDFDYSI